MPRDRHLFAKLRLVAALLPLPLLGGCFAAAALAVPALTGVGIATRNGNEAEQPSPAPVPARVAAAGPTAAPPPAPPAPASRTQPNVTTAILTQDGKSKAIAIPVAALPAPIAARLQGSAGDRWSAFFTYALAHADPPGRNDERISAILAPGSAVEMLPRRRKCDGEDNAVIIDLDPAGGRFSPQPGWQAPADMANQLALLRSAGTVVMWISDLDTSHLDGIAEALVTSGLDPAGKDPILLAIGDGDRKQTLRQQAGQNACVVAIAGDERKDFDELFSYLRDQKAAGNFDALIGSGWFLVPTVEATQTP